MDTLKDDVKHILAKRKNAAIALLLVGVLIGIVIGRQGSANVKKEETKRRKGKLLVTESASKEE